MYVVASYIHSRYVEMALGELEKMGISQSQILAVPLDKQRADTMLLDTINRSDGRSLMDGISITATVFTLLGAIYGLVWNGGPVLWGIIGLFFGGLLGWFLDLTFSRLRSRVKKETAAEPRIRSCERPSEISLIVSCPPDQADIVEKTLWRYYATAIGEFGRNAV